MKAIVYEEYGSPEVLQLKEVEKPTPSEDQVLIQVHAASVNYGDVAVVTGKPFLVRLMGYGILKPKHQIPGGDVAGRIEAVGSNVTRFQPGDAVFGDIGECGFGALAEYVSAPESVLVLKPATATFQEAASVPQAAVVALQGLRDRGEIQPGQKILVNGASGGIGTFAVQIAKAFGAEVTGVCSTKNLEMVRSIGADHVIDYTQQDFTKGERRYDLILDIVANRSISAYTDALSPKGVYVAVAFNPSSLFLGSLYSKADGKQVRSLSHKPKVEDLVVMKELVETGKVTPVIDSRYPLHEAAQAFRRIGEGHPQGKVVIMVQHAAG